MRQAFFDWSDEVQKQTKKQDIELAALLFLVGLLLFFYPVITQVSSYQADEEEYEEMALQFQPPESDPVPVIPIKRPTIPPTEIPVISATSGTRNEDNETRETVTDSPVVETVASEPPSTPLPTVVAKVTMPPLVKQTAIVLPTAFTTEKPIPLQTAAPTKTPSKPSATPMQAGIDLEACLAQNKDFVAWLTIPGTKINYPVVRSNDSEYYLHHLFSGKESKLGCLFSLKSSDYRTPSKNIAIYGHHISHSDAMFSTLMDYKDSSYCATHSLIHLESLYGEKTYRIFAVLNMNVSEWDAATASFSSNDSFVRFVNRAIEKSMFDTGVQVHAEDSILTLITCDRSYGGASGRLIVMAVQE